MQWEKNENINTTKNCGTYNSIYLLKKMSALVRGVKSGASLDLVVQLAYNCVFN